MTKCKREGCNHEIEWNPYWSVIGYCSRSCHLKDKKKKLDKMRDELPRCKDNCWRDRLCPDWYTPWCPHSKLMTTEDEVKMKKDYTHGRCVNWLRICEKTGKVVVHNKKCDVPEVIALQRGKTI